MLNEIPEDNFLSISPYPLTLLQPVASRWAIEASKYTWWGCTHMHIADGQKHHSHMEALITAAGVEIKAIEAREKELEAEREKMKNVMDVYAEFQQKLREKEQAESKLSKEVAEMKTQSIVRGTLLHLKQSKARSSTELTASGYTPPAEHTVSAAPGRPSFSAQMERPPIDFSSDDEIPDSPPSGNGDKDEDEGQMDLENPDDRKAVEKESGKEAQDGDDA